MKRDTLHLCFSQENVLRREWSQVIVSFCDFTVLEVEIRSAENGFNELDNLHL